MRKFAFLLAFVCALAVSSFAQTAQDITVSGILYNGFNDPCTSCTFTVTVTRRDGVAVQSTPRTVTSHASTGAVSFTLPRKSFVTFQGSYTVGRYNWRNGISMFLPDQSTIDLVDIQSVDDAAAALVAVSAAPSDAQYVVGTANGTLSAEQNLGALTTGLLLNTVASSVGTLSTATAGTHYVAPGATTTSGLTMATARILGRSTASTGAIEEISIGSGLSLSGGTLSASGGGAVSSVFGRTGAVTAATNDYTWAQIDKTTSSLADITTRSASDLSSGTLAAARGGAGTVSGILKADGAGLVSAASAGTDYEVPLTFSTGLTRSTNTITVNTSQNIATLSNLTSNGLVTTSGGAGTLGVTVPGTGVLTALAVNIGSAGAPVLFDGAGGTPSSLMLTNATGLPLSTGVTGDLPFANFVQAGSAGFVGATGAGDYSHRTPTQVTAALDNFVGDSGSGGTKGLVPAPASGDAAANKYLKADGTWATVSGGSGITVGTTTVTSGTATRLFYETAGNVVGQVSGVTSDGTNVTAGSGNLRATSPRITTDISDSNGNEIFRITATGSAVNEITVANAATGGNPTLSATGGDTNVGIAFATKGTGKVQVTPGTGGSSTLQVNHSDGTPLFQIGGFSSTPTAATLYMGNITPSTTNYTLLDFTDLYVNARAGGAVLIRSNNSAIASFTTTNGLAIGSSTDAGLTRLAAGVLRATNGSTGAGSLVLGTSTVGSIGTSGVGVLAIANGTAPTSSPADEFQLYSADSAAGDANAFARNEAGEINRLTGLAARNSSSFAKTSDTTLANITGLTRNVEAGRTYYFETELSTTSANTGGVKFAISGTATATAIDYEGVLRDGTTISAATRATALNTTVCDVTAVTAATCRIRGVIVVNAAGTITVQFAQNASDGSASTVLVNQAFSLRPIS